MSGHRVARMAGKRSWWVLVLAIATLPLASHAAEAADRDGDGLRDRFERRGGVTDPGRSDTDGDGLIDAAEDPDGDLLSNLGEQRYGTDPDRRDSDRDGVGDGAEDADGDGRTNTREQDQWPLPRDLSPDLSEAPTAWPWARATCQTAHGKSRIRPCVFGDRRGDLTVVLFGDSHATQWQPALARAGKQEGWRVVMITKTGCPSVDVQPDGQQALDEGVSCRTWRARGIRWIQEHRPDVVIISNLARSLSNALVWRHGLTSTLAAMPRRTTTVVLADTPRLQIEPVPCLGRHPNSVAACVTSRAEAQRPLHDRNEFAAARAAGAEFMNLGLKVCPYDPCPLVIGTTLVWRDAAHITAAFSKQLAPSMRDRLRATLDRAGGGSVSGETARTHHRPPRAVTAIVGPEPIAAITAHLESLLGLRSRPTAER